MCDLAAVGGVRGPVTGGKTHSENFVAKFVPDSTELRECFSKSGVLLDEEGAQSGPDPETTTVSSGQLDATRSGTNQPRSS
jgi:hypothetical protein